MADEQTNEQGPSIEDRAKKMGWKPKEEFRGDPDRWSDAETYVRRGEEVLPIVQSTNRRLTETVEQQNARILELERTNKANTAALEAIQETSREQTVQHNQQSVEQLTEAIAQAHAADDVREELRLRDLRDEARETLRASKVKPTPSTNGNGNAQPSNGAQDPSKTPEFQQFLTDNPWWQKDPVMRAASIEIQNQLYTAGDITADMPQAQRLAKVAEATRQRFGVKEESRRGSANRVEGGGGPGSGNSGAPSHTYADLPDQAKEACDRAAKRLTFGAQAKYKDISAWRQSYTNTYFST